MNAAKTLLAILVGFGTSILFLFVFMWVAGHHPRPSVEWRVVDVSGWRAEALEEDLRTLTEEGWEVVAVVSEYCGSTFRVVARRRRAMVPQPLVSPVPRR